MKENRNRFITTARIICFQLITSSIQLRSRLNYDHKKHYHYQNRRNQQQLPDDVTDFYICNVSYNLLTKQLFHLPTLYWINTS